MQSASYGVIPRGYPGWLASNAASCKSLKYWLGQQCRWPPALPVFPANREFYREFCKIADSGRSEASSNGVVTGLPTRIPYAKKQGIIFAEQGIWTREQEILAAEVRVIPPGEISGYRALDDVRFTPESGH